MMPPGLLALVVDDEPVVRRFIRRLLEPDACGIVEAADGEAALRLIEQNRPAVDLVLTDLRMPGIDGFDLLEVLAAHRPDLPVLCMSGFPTFAAGPMPRVPFLAKPFTSDALRQAIEPVLARARSRALPAGPVAVDLVAAARRLQHERAQRPPA
jgi:CheY-like chemotaxis protein